MKRWTFARLYKVVGNKKNGDLIIQVNLVEKTNYVEKLFFIVKNRSKILPRKIVFSIKTTPITI